jgi:hypothetical protein
MLERSGSFGQAEETERVMELVREFLTPWRRCAPERASGAATAAHG